MKNKDSAIISFIFALLCWVPWLNLAFGTLALGFGLRGLYLQRKAPSRYGGFWLAVIGTAIGSLTLILTALGPLLGF